VFTKTIGGIKVYPEQGKNRREEEKQRRVNRYKQRE
jgi:hypothetical protein